MWNIENKKYNIRPLRISKSLYSAIKKYSLKYEFSKQFTIRKALYEFFDTTKMGKDYINLDKQKEILSLSSMPSNKNEKNISLNIRKIDIDIIKKINNLEQKRFCNSTEESIRRILTWYLKTNGFL